MIPSARKFVILAGLILLAAPTVWGQASGLDTFMTAYYFDPTVLPWDPENLHVSYDRWSVVPAGSNIDIRAQIIPANYGPGAACPCNLTVDSSPPDDGVTVTRLTADTFKIAGRIKATCCTPGLTATLTVNGTETFAEGGGLVNVSATTQYLQCGQKVRATATNYTDAGCILGTLTECTAGISYFVFVPPGNVMTVKAVPVSGLQASDSFALNVYDFSSKAYVLLRLVGSTFNEGFIGRSAPLTKGTVFETSVKQPAAGQTYTYDLSADCIGVLSGATTRAVSPTTAATPAVSGFRP